MLVHIYTKARYAWLFIRKAGMGGFARHLRLQLCGRSSFVTVVKDLNVLGPEVELKLKYTLRLATERDMQGLLRKLEDEDSDSAYELLGRKLFYDRGFHSCYLAEVAPGDPCHLAWLLRPRDNDLIGARYARLSPLKPGEVMLENSFTFARYRGNGVMASVAQDLSNIARAEGFSRMLAYVDKSNQSSLKSLARAGFSPRGEAKELKVLFTTRRKYSDSGDETQILSVAHKHKCSRTGAIVIGGSFQALGILRSLWRRGIPVYLVDSELSIARFSRCKQRYFRSPKVSDSTAFVAFLRRLAAEHTVEGWVIYPNDDETAALLSMFREELGRHYRVPSPPWSVVELAYDKRLTYRLAERLAIPIPKTFYPCDKKELEALELEYPVIIKPAIRVNFYGKTKRKALRADSREELLYQYERATAVIPPAEVMVQELVPGGPRNLYSFGSFFKGGEVIGKVVARRSRQHPMDFGHATTFAETVNVPDIEELATRLLRAMDYYGISEVEFMQDPRDGKYKLIEMNARPWGWHSLAIAAGADLPYLLYQDALGKKVSANGFEKGLKWVRMVTDIPTASAEILRGRMSLTDYLTSLKGKKTFAEFSLGDPLPFLAEIAFLPYFWKKGGF